MADANEDRESWRLISVLFSSMPLSPGVAQRLAKTAFELYAADAVARTITGGTLQGEVRNLRKDLLLGTIPGHAFEAELDTERGHLTVRYLLTDDGLEAFAQARPRGMMN